MNDALSRIGWFGSGRLVCENRLPGATAAGATAPAAAASERPHADREAEALATIGPAAERGGRLIRLDCSRTDNVWLIFPTRALRALYLRHRGADFGYHLDWIDVQGFGLHLANPVCRDHFIGTETLRCLTCGEQR